MAIVFQIRKNKKSEPKTHQRARNRKFMQTLAIDTYAALEGIADSRGVSIQELIRAQIIPDWLRVHREES